MVAWLPDPTGRFPRRPHYAQAELDRLCEVLVGSFLRDRHAEVCFPLTTADLTVLVERHCSDLDTYADLSAEGEEVEGMTVFLRGALPEISIAAELAADARRENRLRTTLAHELAHAALHRPLYDELFAANHLLEPCDPQLRAVSTRGSVLGAREVDWMEWQAGYASGAILMPRSALARLVADFCTREEVYTAVHVEHRLASGMQEAVMRRFQVSEEAARVRLLKLGFLTRERPGPSLFG